MEISLAGGLDDRISVTIIIYAGYIIAPYCDIFQNGMNAVSMNIAEQYVSAFSNLAKKGNTVLLPTNTGDISGMVSQVNIRQISAFSLILSLLVRNLSSAPVVCLGSWVTYIANNMDPDQTTSTGSGLIGFILFDSMK